MIIFVKFPAATGRTAVPAVSLKPPSVLGADGKVRGPVAESTEHGDDPWGGTLPGAPDRFLASDLANEIEFLAARARALGSGHANAMLAPLDLKVRSYSVLAMACSGSEPSQRELADFLRLDPSQIVALVDALEQRGLVLRAPDPRDRRSKIIRPTAAGTELHLRASSAVRAAEATSLAQLDGTERDQLRELLRKIAFS
jgi:DNA-binding MarR family transcriptional regulator